MSEMVERVARAIVGVGDPVSQDFAEWRVAVARAAIAAMREPTEAMVAAGEQCEEHYGYGEGCAPCTEHWPAMIDAALK